MCRFIAYRGEPVVLDDVLHQPNNSLIKQSANAHESEEPLNGDGFGVGWYNPEIDTEPGLYVSVRPAWNDRNLRHLSRHIRTGCLFAHVRAASEGEVSEANCHPFQYKNYLFMHNGGIGGFQKLKRRIRRGLSDEIYDWIRGQTDSEHLFAIFLDKLRTKPTVDAQVMTATMEETIRFIQGLKRNAGIDEDCYINCAVTDGKSVVAVRYVSNRDEKASTLYYSAGQHYICRDGVCEMIPGMNGSAKPRAVLIVSEKLTEKREDWNEIPTNFICTIDEKLRVQLHEIDDGLHVDPKVDGQTDAKKKEAKGFRPKRSA